MYSAVLMLALTAGSETADFGRNRCNGCTSTCATTTVARTCSTSCASSCSRPRLFGGGHGCASSHRCSTSCSTTAHHRAPACSTSCSSSCSHGGLFSRFRNRCSSSCTVTCSTGCSTTTTPAAKPLPKSGEPVKEPKKTSLSAPATIVVSLPAGARLIVDGNATTSVSERRTLVTPELEVGSTYVYTMRAEVGTQVQTQEVNVRGGETTTVQFTFPSQGVASR